jgi:hypothetical protein
MSRARSLRRHDWDEDGSELFVEPALARRRRLDHKAKDDKKAHEVDRSGSVVNLERAAKRLKRARAEARILSVPQWDMAKAIEAMKRAGVSGEVTNLCGSRLKRVKLVAGLRRDDDEDAD